ncbi:hypothetical protein GCM10011611_31090 [Aliidongia dinghuensis]|uniref:Uncharacterized protein n=1 Tax=Aliidongia dinghuensis TaxID=1867774 RepID=A0A8J2YVA1_9PROT|nr:phage portal protein [Aliidongia dinghuensis]GGF22821.1 hypothetical protein GCM10011611_31090 [Aliidongia dinghuensis]
MPQIRQFQEYWDALLEGNLAARRHTRFVPGGLKYQPVRDVPLKDEFDEWLARVVCFAFSIPPTAFARTTNRATAETAQGSALAEGLQPLMGWVKGLIDRVLAQVLGWPDLEFAWADQTATEPQAQATIAAAYVAAGIKTRNEVRAELGLAPIAGGDTLTTATPASPLPGSLAKAGFDPDQPRDDRGRWSGNGNETGTNSLPAVASPDNHAGGHLVLAQELVLPDALTAFGRLPFSLRGLPDEVLNQFKETVPRLSGKEGAKGPPSWAEGFRPMIRENGSDFAKRLLDERYGPGNWGKGQTSEYNRIQKWGDRNFRIPKSLLERDEI